MFSQFKIDPIHSGHLPKGFRVALIEDDRDRQLPAVLFHRNPDGSNLNAVSGFRYHELSLTAFGRAACEELHDSLPVIVDLLAIRIGEIPRWQVRSGETSISVAEELYVYSVNAMVLEKRYEKERMGRDAVKSQFNEEGCGRIAATIRRSLECQSELLLGTTFPEDAVIGDVKFLGTVPMVPTACGKRYYARGNITFRSNLNLRGPWAVGSFAHKGCGGITRAFSIGGSR